jgi:hypothetical protein
MSAEETIEPEILMEILRKTTEALENLVLLTKVQGEKIQLLEESIDFLMVVTKP